ncbi:bifunctional adenosylcobinamide kinase/adenosylcobinamide-phosphate guanylyltransferase [Kitasatospora purpeofusca]|uniref:bifunctional adenosylcobinamide kinase/adenosylcobinamide-phosphate guanylyltransferase n=1 Tax=Kitasatospora purpeofusca TaxID=67352 RepID=UPI0035E12012
MITLVLGGRRSGKSDIAQEVVGSGPVTYLATLVADTPVTEARVARHRSVRPASWRVVEEPREIAAVLRASEGTVLVEDLTGWVGNDVEGADFESLAFALGSRAGDTVLVSEDVSAVRGRLPAAEERYYDRLGELNQIVSRMAQRVLYVVAARAVEVPRWHPEGSGIVPLDARPGYGLPSA